MKVRISVGVLLCAVLLGAHAEVPAGVGICVACHGSDGQGNPTLGAPRLAGQQAVYLETQLQNFKSGRRGYDARDTHGAQMRGIASSLSEGDIQTLAGYFSSTAIAGEQRVAQPADSPGEVLYQTTCAACHGPKAKGFAHLKTPNLGILDSAYIERQLEHFAQGLRGGDNHADELGIWMRGIALQIANEGDRKAIATYIGSQTSAAP